MRILAFALSLSLVIPAAAQQQPAEDEGGTFRVQKLKGKVFQRFTDPEESIHPGDLLPDGTSLRVAWRSNAKLRHLACESTIRIAPRARVLLGDEDSGRMLLAEHGRLRADVQADADGDPLPWIETPRAKLVASDAEYGIAVGRHGNTLLVVFSGSVEVRPTEGDAEPLKVEAGSFVSIRHGPTIDGPEPHEVSPRGWDQGESPWQWNDGDDA